MPLPNAGMTFTPFDPLPASDLNDIVENVEALADGSGANANSVLSASLKETAGCRAYRNSALTITSSGDKVVFNAENFDSGGNFNTTTGAYTAPSTGRYFVTSTVGVNNLDAGGQLYLEIYVNGAFYCRGTRFYTVASTDDPAAIVSSLVPVTSGQTVEIYATSSTSESIQTGSSSSYMSIHRVGG